MGDLIFTKELLLLLDEDNCIKLEKFYQIHEKHIDWATTENYLMTTKNLNSSCLALLAYMHSNGYHVTSDPTKARDYYQQAIDAGNMIALNNLSMLDQAVETDQTDQQERRFKCYQTVANAGLACGFHNMGSCYLQSKGVTGSGSDAIICFEKSIKMGSRESLKWLGLIYIKGEHVEKNIEKGFKMLLKYKPIIYFKSHSRSYPSLDECHAYCVLIDSKNQNFKHDNSTLHEKIEQIKLAPPNTKLEFFEIPENNERIMEEIKEIKTAYNKCDDGCCNLNLCEKDVNLDDRRFRLMKKGAKLGDRSFMIKLVEYYNNKNGLGIGLKKAKWYIRSGHVKNNRVISHIKKHSKCHNENIGRLSHRLLGEYCQILTDKNELLENENNKLNMEFEKIRVSESNGGELFVKAKKHFHKKKKKK